jgi:hypothetical protein
MELFGFKLERSKAQKQTFKAMKSFVVPTTDDGAIPVEAGGFYGQYVDLDGTVRNDFELIAKYREMSMDPVVETAIDDIVNEAIVTEMKTAPVKILFNADLQESESVKEKIHDEFKTILRMLSFDTKGYDIFRRWYVDGKIYFHLIVDEDNPEKGILEARYVDPLNIQKIREFKKETRPDGTKIVTGYRDFYLYNKDNPRVGSPQGLKISEDAISFCSSGLFDTRYRRTVGFLHKAIKPMNQLRMMEDAVVIYRISRAPERRIFYIDTGNLPKTKAEAYVKNLMNQHRNKLVYDAGTGEIRDDRKFMSMLEDYWLPRKEGSKGTEITTLAGAQNLGELADIVYFQKKLYKALNVPVSRLESDKGFQLGRAAEISRDELKFNKFVNRLRSKFNEVFYDLLRKQLILKKIIKPDEWSKFKDHIFFDYLKDSHFVELKNAELRRGQYEELNSIEKYIGKYYSHHFVRTHILNMSENEIAEMKKQIEKERNEGQYPPDNTAFGLQ